MSLELITWQTTLENDKGYERAVVNTALRHQNVGHAAVKLVLPVTDETTDYLTKMSARTGIPYYLVRHAVPKGDVSYSDSTMPVISKNKENVHTEAQYHVYFSFWPGDKEAKTEKGKRYNLHTAAEDAEAERRGVDYYNESRRKDLISSEQIEIQEVRNEKGKLLRTHKLSPKIQHGNEAEALNAANQVFIVGLKSKFQELNGKIQANLYKQGSSKTLTAQDFEFLHELAETFPHMQILERFNIKKLQDEDGNLLEGEAYINAASEMILDMNKLNSILNKASDQASLEYSNQLYRFTGGSQGDDRVSLPVMDDISGSAESKSENEYTLSPLRMLQRMEEIVEHGKYGFYKYNCSNAAEDVILSGIQNDGIRDQFIKTKRHTMLPSTPQIARRKTIGLAQEVQNKWKGRETKLHKAADNISQTIQVIEKKLVDDIRKKEVIIKKEDIASVSDPSKPITPDQLNDLTKMMRTIRKNQGKLPVIDAQLKKK